MKILQCRELNVTGSEIVVHTGTNEISLTNLKVSSSKAGDSRERTRRYGFDYCFDSSDPTAENYADQTKIYETLGQSVLDSLFSGYNTCLVAYGQSASGKTYTMMGSKDDPGLTPRLCEGLFSRVEKEAKNDKLYHVSVSYLEIYNERVRDLLKPSTSTSGLRVREHPRLGPYVQGLTHQVVNTLGSLMSYVEEGTKARKTAPTLQNPSSSRSHALLTVALTTNSTNGVVNGGESSTPSSRRTDPAPRGQSKLHLVDLAGSENAATCSGVHRLKEGANINKSLVALGNVISALAERGSNGASPTGRKFIPYRDSSLTWLLKDALGGNATTIMLATISPASGSYNETAHTLRFAQRAQSVVNRPVVNENPVARIIRELRAEVARLKSLLLEKNIVDESKTICCCKHDREAEEPEKAVSSKVKEEEGQKLLNEECKIEDVTGKVDSVRPVRRFSSGEILAAGKAKESDVIRKFGSYELLTVQRGFASRGYNRAEVAELKDEDDEVIEEIIEPAFVDIPTLVAVLIKPDDNLPVGSTQIEEICSDEVAEDSIEGDFLDTISDRDVHRDIRRTSTFGNLYKDQRTNLGDNLFAPEEVEAKKSDEDATPTVSRIAQEISTVAEKKKFRKQDSIDGRSSDKLLNLQALKRFGSAEGLQKKPAASLERANTTLDKRLLVVDKAKKLNNIKETEDHKASGGSKFWKPASNTSSKESLQRKGSNDSDKSSKDSYSLTGVRGKALARKTSLEGLKRETSKDSSSSSSKDEQILISNLTRDKLLRRKSSLDQDANGLRPHTPIQRSNRRAEIVAAVTQRLYNNRKHAEDLSTAPSSAGGFRSPPDLGADVKPASSTNFAARMKLQEISRKMLGKRRRACVDTQTDDQTVRVKDATTITEEPKIVTQEVGVLTELHENCMDADRRDNVSVLRVKEIATSTDRPKINIVRCKDVECFVNDLEDEDCELHSPRNDSGILSDDTQNYAESNLSSAETSDLCPETDRRTVFAENSTNTYRMSLAKNSEVQTPSREMKKLEQQEIVPPCSKPCCKSVDIPQSVCQHCCHGSSPSNSERNVISISLPDMINITIESSNVLESRIALMDTADSTEEKVRPHTKESGAQTDNKDGSKQESRFCFKDFSMKPAMSQTDGRIFRIENIFQDPNNTSMTPSKVEAFVEQGGDFHSKKSVTFTSSLGTSSALNTFENTIDMNREKSYSDHQYSIGQNLTSVKPFLPDGLITEVFVSKKRKPTSCSKKRRMIASDDSRKNSETPYSVNTANSVNFKREENNFPALWEKINEEKSTPFWTNAQERLVTCESPAFNSPSEKAVKQSCETLQTNSFNLPLDISSGGRCTTEMKFPPTVAVPSNTLDMDHSFSDDSLDYSEDCPFTNNTDTKMNDDEDRECKHFCPPDVVAHTKKDTSQATEQTDVETNDTSLIPDFEDCHVEIPKTKPGIPTDSVSGNIHDYKSLIFGEHCSVMEEDSLDVSACNSNNAVKKKVSFSKASVIDEKDNTSDRRESVQVTRNSNLPKPIIKKQNKSISNMSDVVQSSNDEGDDSSQDRTSLLSLSPTSGKPLKSQYSRHEDDIFGFKSFRDSDDSAKSSPESDRKKVRFSKDDLSEESVSDSNSYDDVDLSDEGEDSCPTKTRRSIVEEYFNEAVKFMRNMNSINEFMSVAKVCHEHVACGRRRKYHRRRCAARNQDYVDYRGQRISLKDNMDEYLKDDDDIFVPTETYEKCLKGIARLETRIGEVSRHNEHLRDKCGIDVTSAGAKSILANSSTDSRLRSSARVQEPTVQGNTIFRTEEGNHVNTSRNSGLALRKPFDDAAATKRTRCNGATADSNDLDNKNNNVNSGLADDLECQIFQELMNVADATHYSNSKGNSFSARSSRTLNSVLGDESTGAKFRGKYASTHDRSRGRYSHAIYDSAEDLTDEQYVKGTFRAKSCAKVPADRVISWKTGDGKLVGDSRQFLHVDSSGWAPRADVCVATETAKARSSISSTRNKYVGSSRRNLSWRIDTSGIDRSSSTDTITTSTESFDGISHPGDKLRYPGSPRARFLQLLSERRRIVQSSRASEAS